MKNVIANLFGKGMSALINLLLIPIYVKLMGIEAYGLIGIFMTLTILFSLLDGGFGSAFTRELASKSSTKRRLDLLATLEVYFWAMSLVIIVCSLFISPNWVHTSIPVKGLFGLMGITIAINFPLALYSGGVIGLQKQVTYNTITSFFALLKGAALFYFLSYVSSSPMTFLLVTLGIVVLQTVTMRIYLKHLLGPGRGLFSLDYLKEVLPFSLGVGGIVALFVFLMQIDKVLLMRLVSLETFGYYSLAWNIASGLLLITSAVTMTYYPRFTELISFGRDNELVQTYHKACLLLSLLVFPIGIFLSLFSFDVLRIWTGDLILATRSAHLLSLLLIGMMFHALISLPLMLQLAYGKIKLPLMQNIVGAILLVPLLFFLTNRYGITGAAYLWIALNVGFFLSTSIVMYKKVLQGERERWLIKSIALPLGAALVIPLALKVFV